MTTRTENQTTMVGCWLDALSRAPWRSQFSQLVWRTDSTPKGRTLRVITGNPKRTVERGRFLPTPLHRDYKDVGDPSTSVALQQNSKRRMLGAVVVVESGKPGALHSEFSRLLMGYPSGWLIDV